MDGVKALVVLASIYYPGDGIVAKNNYQTSSGERYDQSAPKCAALQWSLGTMLHLVHGRINIDVTINDHGPYRKGRALDCTPAVDKALHLGGLGSVRVEAYPPLPKARPWKIPKPPRTAVLPLPKTSQAKPRRGAKLFLSGFHSAPTGLSIARCTVPLAICCWIVLPEPR